MQVSVEALQGLERKVTVSVPAEQVEEEVSLRLKDLAQKVKIDGFRPGKVPMNIVKSRYAGSVRQEVAKELVQSTLFEALQEHAIEPAGYPSIEDIKMEAGQDLEYTAKLEIIPSIEVQELEQETVEKISSQVTDDDVEHMLDKLRGQYKSWQAVDRPAHLGDKVIIDFEGFVNDEPFQGGKAEDYELELGSNSMIGGFEEGIVDKEKGQQFDLAVTFPEEYSHADLAGKDAIFKINVKEVKEGILPEIDEKFIEQFNIKEGGVEAFKKDIKENMERELARQIGALNREKAFEKLMEKNKIDLPKALIDREIEQLKHDAYHKIFGPEHSENEKIPDFPRSLFEDQATRRVQLGLLFSEYVKKHEISSDESHVNEKINQMATAYESPEDLKEYFYGDKAKLAEIEALVLEDLVAQKILESATVVEKTLSYDDVMNPKKEAKDKDSEE